MRPRVAAGISGPADDRVRHGLRAGRPPTNLLSRRLEALDKDWMKAMGRGDPATAHAVEEKRQTLRDAPETLAPVLARAKTPDELKTVTLATLGPSARQELAA